MLLLRRPGPLPLALLTTLATLYLFVYLITHPSYPCIFTLVYVSASCAPNRVTRATPRPHTTVTLLISHRLLEEEIADVLTDPTTNIVRGYKQRSFGATRNSNLTPNRGNPGEAKG